MTKQSNQKASKGGNFFSIYVVLYVL